MKIVPWGGSRKGAGRKPLYGDAALEAQVTLKVFPSEHADWKAAARKAGKPLNLWARETLNSAARR